MNELRQITSSVLKGSVPAFDSLCFNTDKIFHALESGLIKPIHFNKYMMGRTVKLLMPKGIHFLTHVIIYKEMMGDKSEYHLHGVIINATFPFGMAFIYKLLDIEQIIIL